MDLGHEGGQHRGHGAFHQCNFGSGLQLKPKVLAMGKPKASILNINLGWVLQLRPKSISTKAKPKASISLTAHLNSLMIFFIRIRRKRRRNFDDLATGASEAWVDFLTAPFPWRLGPRNVISQQPLPETAELQQRLSAQKAWHQLLLYRTWIDILSWRIRFSP